MWDLTCVVAPFAFFALAMFYTTACEHLGKKEST